MRRTALKGHALRSEGKPYVLGALDQERWVRPYGSESSGAALCECGWTSAELASDADRKAWHREHKEKIRNGS